ncbi:hypothetical protein XANCAGTX0491_006612 [Xanthoria calcicola]
MHDEASHGARPFWGGRVVEEELMQGVKALVVGCQVHGRITISQVVCSPGRYKATPPDPAGSPTRCNLSPLRLQGIGCPNKRRASTAPTYMTIIILSAPLLPDTTALLSACAIDLSR